MWFPLTDNRANSKFNVIFEFPITIYIQPEILFI